MCKVSKIIKNKEFEYLLFLLNLVEKRIFDNL
jgi:hypothetical protein